MSIHVTIPTLAIMQDKTFTGTIPLGSPANTNTLIRTFRTKPNTIGLVISIRNDTPAANNVRIYTTQDDRDIPPEMSELTNNWNEYNTEQYIISPIVGDQSIKMYATNLVLAAAAITVHANIRFWYQDWNFVRDLKDTVEYNPYYKMGLKFGLKA